MNYIPTHEYTDTHTCAYIIFYTNSLISHACTHTHFISSQGPIRKIETTILGISNSGNSTQGIQHVGDKRAEEHRRESEETYFFFNEGNSTSRAGGKIVGPERASTWHELPGMSWDNREWSSSRC